jgi:hypothetical protein
MYNDIPIDYRRTVRFCARVCFSGCSGAAGAAFCPLYKPHSLVPAYPGIYISSVGGCSTNRYNHQAYVVVNATSNCIPHVK